MVNPCTRPPRPPGLPTETAVLGRAAGENFPVALRVLPTSVRGHLLAIYGYARFVDQLGDDYAGDRLAALDWLDGELTAALGQAAVPPGSPVGPAADAAPTPGAALHPLVARAARTVVAVGAEPSLLRDLIEANRRDQTVKRYDTFDDLVDYCRYSANPVGRLVLAVFAAATADPTRYPGLAASPERDACSDAVCTGLQVAEHLQDVAEDAVAGRVYLPLEDLRRFGVDPQSLAAGVPASSAQRALIAFEVSRARRLLDAGRPLAAGLAGWSRLAVTAFVAGGDAALDAVAEADFDPLVSSPRPRPLRVAANFARTWRARPAVPQPSGGRP
jgi:squalene synthase HpnC